MPSNRCNPKPVGCSLIGIGPAQSPLQSNKIQNVGTTPHRRHHLHSLSTAGRCGRRRPRFRPATSTGTESSIQSGSGLTKARSRRHPVSHFFSLLLRLHLTTRSTCAAASTPRTVAAKPSAAKYSPRRMPRQHGPGCPPGRSYPNTPGYERAAVLTLAETLTPAPRIHPAGYRCGVSTQPGPEAQTTRTGS